MPKTISILEDFEILATIGSGTYGTCKQICRKSDKKVNKINVPISNIWTGEGEQIFSRPIKNYNYS